MAPNPNPARITAESWRFIEEVLKLDPDIEYAGSYTFKSGYHASRADNDVNWPGDYSVVDAVDRKGPSDKTSGYDFSFRSAKRGDFTKIAKFTSRLDRSARDENDPRLDGLREFYGNTDLDSEVEGYDTRYGFAVSSDDSHLWHIHLSETRGLVGDWNNKLAVLSVLKGESVAAWKNQGQGLGEDDDMPFGTLNEGEKAITVIALPRGKYRTLGLSCDNGLQGLPPAKVRVAVHHGTAWEVINNVVVDSNKEQTVIKFTNPDKTDALSIMRVDTGNVRIGYEVS